MRAFLSILLCALAPCCAADLQPAETVFWEDATGDVIPWSNAPDRPRPDLIRVDAQGVNGAVKITLTLKDPFQKLFDYTDGEGCKYAGMLLDVFIDTDNNPATGGKPSWSSEAGRPLEGYDFMVDVGLGYMFKNLSDGGTGWAAGDTVLNVNKVAIEKPFGKFSVSKIQQGSDSKDYSHKNPDGSGNESMKRTQIAGEKLTIEIPYEWLGVKPGSAIRLCIKDVQEGAASGKNISLDRVLILK